MRKDFVKVMLLGALTLSTVTYVGCKDYDDDISNLQEQVDANKASIADLQKFVNEGKWVKSVESINGGFRLTFSDGKNYDIVNGTKGDTGDTGAIGAAGAPGSKVTIDPVTKEWKIDNVGTGYFAKEGDPGQDGKSPYIDNGYWYYYDAAAKEWVKGPSANATPGQNGKSPYVDKETGLWMFYDDATGAWVQGPKAVGTDGQGTPGYSPYIDKDGYWQFYDDAKKEWVKGAYAQTSVYIVEKEGQPTYELHIGLLNKDGSYTEKIVMLPRAAAIVSMRTVRINSNGSLSMDDAGVSTTSLYYGEAANDIADFNGTSYKKGQFLTSNSGIVHALINPTDLDVSQYTIGLSDSKGRTNFIVSNVAQNMSEKPLTRAAATPNKGIFDLTLAFAKGVKVSDLNDQIAYALTTKDAFGKEIISEYDVKVITSNYSQSISNTAQNVAYKKTLNLDEYANRNELNYVVDYYYSIAKADQAKATELGVILDKEAKTIYADKEGTLPVTINYLKTNGTIATATLTLTFQYEAPAITVADMNWTITGEAGKNVAVSDITALKDLFVTGNYNIEVAAINFTDGTITVDDQKNLAYRGGIAFNLLALDKDNKPVALNKGVKFYVQATFDKSIIAATSHNVKLHVVDTRIAPNNDPLNNRIKNTADFKVVVKQDNSKIFVFKPLSAFFIGTDAVSYGTPGANKIGYNLYELFETINDQANISFSEARPNFGTEAAPVLGAAWLTAPKGAISVPQFKATNNDGAYSTRNLTIAYQPFANTYLTKIQYPFSLTVKSEIKEGTVKGTVSDKFVSLTNKSFTLKQTDFKWKDAYAKDITWSTDARVTAMTLTLSEEAAKYIDVTDTNFKAATGASVTVSLKNNITVISSDVPANLSYITMNVTDQWGATSTVTIPVPVKK